MADGDEEELEDVFEELVQLCRGGDSGERRAKKRPGIVLVPVNNKTDFTSVGGSHWSLLIAVRSSLLKTRPPRSASGEAAGSTCSTFCCKEDQDLASSVLPDQWVFLHLDSHQPGNREAAAAAASALWPVLSKCETTKCTGLSVGRDEIKDSSIESKGSGSSTSPAAGGGGSEGTTEEGTSTSGSPASVSATERRRSKCPRVLEAAPGVYPQQSNSVDCGVFTCWAMRLLAVGAASEGRLLASQELRAHMSQAGAGAERKLYLRWADEVRAANLGRGGGVGSADAGTAVGTAGTEGAAGAAGGGGGGRGSLMSEVT